ncbi:lysophospholipid acyltransferase family protein [Sabulicella glaciei]|uniref:1-acyl-sn-glycerol-3-phosphate acyltransferase n=1 Tax=Sabulicella glaciei TaxID=2984948 RepID=A0ABT3P0A3_9PROT|nr:lysophospholipid acyltransferase family protein [Roseococcus sp. MDT2-1-1]MCW8087785.1 1-acyl-sn-glycerol-3-phosphate acyltransferase [Roseococcus sp. MDT2-1-1]
MLALRSLLFNVLFFGLTATVGFLALPLFLGPNAFVRRMMHLWCGLMVRMLYVVCGTRVELRGREHLPASGPALIASKHQSTFDTFVWFALVPDVAFVMKRELFLLPIYGWYAKWTGHLGVDRTGGMAAMRKLMRDGKHAAAEGRQIVIFPEGTRTAPGERIPYQPGVQALAQTTGLPVTPVATNSGLFWPRRSFLKRPGTLRIHILPPLSGRGQLMERLEAAIEAEQARLD